MPKKKITFKQYKIIRTLLTSSRVLSEASSENVTIVLEILEDYDDEFTDHINDVIYDTGIKLPLDRLLKKLEIVVVGPPEKEEI